MNLYSCGLSSTATIEYSSPSVCLSVCLSVCVCVCVSVCVHDNSKNKAMVFLLFVLRILRPSILGFWKKNKIAFTYFFILADSRS